MNNEYNENGRNSVFDVHQISVDLNLEENIYLRIINKAIDQTKKDIDEVEKALSINDTNKIQTISHRWKGDYANLRVVSLASVAKQLNDVVKISMNSEKINDHLQKFKKCFDDFQKAIQK